MLTKICQKIWTITQRQRDWKRSAKIPIPNKGDLTGCANP